MDDLKDIERKYEAIENASGRNVDMIFMTGLMATGIWQGVLQLARINETLRQMRKEENAQGIQKRA
jgi:hypothetical protein